MEIIPVIDLKRGQVVRARLGRREEYRPIETPLARTSDPVDVVRGLISLHPFQTLYLADLDAIEATGDNDDALRRVKAAFPDLTLWIDNGLRTLEVARTRLDARWGDLVLGSESQQGLQMMRALAGDAHIVLSLDFRGEAFQGPPELLADPGLWPRRVIAMTLARVGSGAGPDIGRLAMLRAFAPDCMLYAAGGVRDIADIQTLAAAGIAGALVATSLHDGRLGPREIALAQALGVRR